MKPIILVLGYRKPFYHYLAHQRLTKHDFLFIDENCPQKVFCLKQSFDDIDAILGQMQNIEVTTVIAATEKAVLPAALLRQRLRLKGESVDLAIRCTNKIEMKNWAQDHAIPITPYIVTKASKVNRKEVEAFQTPLVIKNISGSGGRNTIYLHSKEDIHQHNLKNRIIESFIPLKECSVETIVSNGKILFTNTTDYFQKYTANILPASFTEEQLTKILELNQKVIKSFQIQNSFCHAEYYYSEDKVIFGEIAIRPPGGYLMHILEIAYGRSFWEIFHKIQSGEGFKLPTKTESFVASWIIHPGAGKVEAITGWDTIKGLSSFHKGQLKLKIGDILTERSGSGQDYGYVIFQSKSPEKLRHDIISAEKLLEIRLNDDSSAAVARKL